MSSHHFVREDQEPALFIHDLSGVSLDLLGNLLEWSPYVIVMEAEVALFLQLGFKMDAEVKIAANSKDSDQDSVKSMVLKHDGDFAAIWNDLDNRGQKNVNIITTESRLTHFLAQRQNGPLDTVIFTEKYRYITCQGSFSKWYPAATSVLVLPLTDAMELTSSGFLQDSNQNQLVEPVTLITQKDGMISIEASGSFLLAEHY